MEAAESQGRAMLPCETWGGGGLGITHEVTNVGQEALFSTKGQCLHVEIQAHACTRRPGWGLWEILLYHALPYCFGAGSLTKSAVQHF